jgi:hypothetical protein
MEEQLTSLTDLLRDRGIKHKWVANQLKISDSHLCLMLQGKRNWQHEHVQTLGKVLKLNIPSLLKMIDGVKPASVLGA